MNTVFCILSSESLTICFVKNAEHKILMTADFAGVVGPTWETILRAEGARSRREIGGAIKKDLTRSEQRDQEHRRRHRISYRRVRAVFDHVAGGHAWWWAMLFPAFGSLASGISQFAEASRLEKKAKANPLMQPQFPAQPQNAPLPPLPAQNDYVQPRPGSLYDTGEIDLRPPSVTEGTTRHLEMDSEGRTMTLPMK
jgi:hypothetical protein